MPRDSLSSANDSSPSTPTNSTPPNSTPPNSTPNGSAPHQTAPHGSTSASVLKAAALMFVLVGGGIATWTLAQWVEHPEIRATQFDASAPLWPAATLFVVLATAAGVSLLWRAARRVESGEDLYADRHRRSLSDMRDGA